jgi:hypothetical protein
MSCSIGGPFALVKAGKQSWRAIHSTGELDNRTGTFLSRFHRKHSSYATPFLVLATRYVLFAFLALRCSAGFCNAFRRRSFGAFLATLLTRPQEFAFNRTAMTELS